MKKCRHSLFRKWKHSIALITLMSSSIFSQAQYCIPSSLFSCTDGDQIETFILVGDNGTQINQVATGCSTDGYDDQTSLPAVTLGQGETYAASLSSGYFDDVAAAWIDFDNSNSFEPGERVMTFDGPFPTLPSTATVNFNIPSTAALGTFRMRVVVAYKYSDLGSIMTASDIDPCNINPVWEFGEAHDYMVTIGLPPTCPTPSGMSVANVTTSTAEVNWSGTGNFILEYGPSGFTPGTGATAGAGMVINPASATQALNGLSPYTVYDVYVRQDCGVAGFSSNSVVSFTTLPVIPSNDECIGAINITSINPDASCGTTTYGITAGATNSPEAASCSSSGISADVWYSFTATSNIQTISIPNASSPSNTFFALGIAVYSGDCGSLVEVECENYILDSYFGSVYSYPMELTTLVPGETYYVRVYVSDFSTNTNANFDLCIGVATPPVNNECIAAFPITGSGTLTGNNFYATESNSSITCEGYTSSGANDVWYSFIPSSSGNVNINVSQSDLDIVAELFSGTCGALTSIGCIDEDPAIVASVVAGETYLLRVYGYGGSTGTFDINVNGVPLPITASSLSGQLVNQKPVLKWATYNEENNRGFELQQSADGNKFETIGYVPSQTSNGNSESSLNYEFTYDETLHTEAFYRYVQHDLDGRSTLSNVVRLQGSTQNSFDIVAFPNPASDNITLKVFGTRANNAQITVTDALGKTVLSAPVNHDAMNLNISHLPAGLYLIKYTDNMNSRVVKLTKK